MDDDLKDLADQFSKELTISMNTARDKHNLKFPVLDRMRSDHDDVETAKRLVTQSKVPSGFRDLALAGLLELSIENLVIDKRFAPLFTDREIQLARRRLKPSGE